jgi:hypothetical protein
VSVVSTTGGVGATELRCAADVCATARVAERAKTRIRVSMAGLDERSEARSLSSGAPTKRARDDRAVRTTELPERRREWQANGKRPRSDIAKATYDMAFIGLSGSSVRHSCSFKLQRKWVAEYRKGRTSGLTSDVAVAVSELGPSPVSAAHVAVAQFQDTAAPTLLLIFTS